MSEIKKAPDMLAEFEAWAKPYWFSDGMGECWGSDAKDAAWEAWAERSSLIDDLALVLEKIAADADVGEVLITSGIRTMLDAALIKAGRKAAPEPVRVVTIAGDTK